MLRYRLFALTSVLLITLSARAQQPPAAPAPPPAAAPVSKPAPQPPASQPPAAQPPAKSDPMNPQGRLASAKTAWIRKAGGSDIPYNVFSSDLEGWAHFTLVNDPEKADIILEIEAPGDSNGVNIGGTSRTSMDTGRPESSTWLKRETGRTEVKLTVHDARSNNVLWTASEQSKPALKKTSRENNLVEAAERLFTRFHDRIEPPAPR